jgi:hypothetical protein
MGSTDKIARPVVECELLPRDHDRSDRTREQLRLAIITWIESESCRSEE